MIQFNLKIFSIMFLCIAISSCENNRTRSGQNTVNSFDKANSTDSIAKYSIYSVANSLNDKATSLANKYPTDKDTLYKSLMYLNKAIKLNSSNIWFYVNKMNILSSLKQREESIAEANVILAFKSENVAININAYLTIGNEYAKLNKTDSANIAYNKAKALLLNEMKTDDNMNYQITLFTILSLQKGKKAALRYFNNTLDSGRRTDYIKTFIDTFNVNNYLMHY